MPGLIQTSPSIFWRQIRIPWLYCKDDSHLYSMVVVPILPDTKHLDGPSLHLITLLQGHSKFINTNGFPLWHFKNAKGRWAILKSPHPKLHIILLSLVPLDQGLLPCNLQLGQMLGDCPSRIKISPLVANETCHLIKMGIWPGRN